MNRLPSTTKAIKIRAYLKQGGIIAYPTESSFGLGVMPNKPIAIKRLIRLKKRPLNKGLIVIAGKITQLKPYIKPLSQNQQTFLTSIWPATKTFLIAAKPTVYPLLRGTQRDKLAIRIPNHQLARTLCLQLKTPLTSTSANLSHHKTCFRAKEVKKQFGSHVWVIDGLTGKNKSSSEIIDLETAKRLR